MYAHGYVPVQAPLALPFTELTLSDGTFVPGLVLSQGFAFATSSYHKNGYAVEQARKDLADLVKHFKTLVPAGSLHKVFITGASEGGEIATMLIERYPNKYDGALALCRPVGGASFEVQYLSDFRVVFDQFFPGVLPVGAANVPPTPISIGQTTRRRLPRHWSLIPRQRLNWTTLVARPSIRRIPLRR